MKFKFNLAIPLLLVLYFCSPLIGSEYSREKFKHWSDLDNNGFDTRQDALLVQAVSVNDGIHLVTLDSIGNRVEKGLWVCPYTGEVVTDPDKLDIDHIVPLKYAWEHGADKWNNIQREMFANDPYNLLVTRDYINRAKGAEGPETWLPPNISYHAVYIAKFIFVCKQYNLSCDYNKLNAAIKFSRERTKGIRD